MGYSSGINFFKPIIKKLFSSAWEAKQYGLVLVLGLFFLCFTILELISLIFTGKTFSTAFKKYAKKEPDKAKKVVEAISYTFENIEEHFLKRLGDTNASNFRL